MTNVENKKAPLPSISHLLSSLPTPLSIKDHSIPSHPTPLSTNVINSSNSFIPRAMPTTNTNTNTNTFPSSSSSIDTSTTTNTKNSPSVSTSPSTLSLSLNDNNDSEITMDQQEFEKFDPLPHINYISVMMAKNNKSPEEVETTNLSVQKLKSYYALKKINDEKKDNINESSFSSSTGMNRSESNESNNSISSTHSVLSMKDPFTGSSITSTSATITPTQPTIQNNYPTPFYKPQDYSTVVNDAQLPRMIPLNSNQYMNIPPQQQQQQQQQPAYYHTSVMPVVQMQPNLPFNHAHAPHQPLQHPHPLPVHPQQQQQQQQMVMSPHNHGLPVSVVHQPPHQGMLLQQHPYPHNIPMNMQPQPQPQQLQHLQQFNPRPAGFPDFQRNVILNHPQPSRITKKKSSTSLKKRKSSSISPVSPNSTPLITGKNQGNFTLDLHHMNPNGSSNVKRRSQNIDGSKPHIICLHCGSTETPEWRKGPLGERTLCNACGLFFAKMVKKFGEPISVAEMSKRKEENNENDRRVSLSFEIEEQFKLI